jgi:endo-alpha-1,4-polygalactosaminidase (GH114 family)
MDRRGRFQEINNFVIYYGHDKEEKLCKYDAAIIEPKGHSPEGIGVLKSRNCLAIAYLSVIEISPTDYRFRYLRDEDFILCDGQKEVNTVFGNYMADIRSKRWQDILMHECGRLIEDLGYDGIFLDTIGNVENPRIRKEHQNSLINESILFLHRLRNKYPDHIIIQNNAIEKLISYTSGIIDGICWENPPVGIKRSRLWMDEIISRLSKVKKEDRVKVLVVSESDDPDDVRKLQFFDDLGYVTSISSINYLTI